MSKSQRASVKATQSSFEQELCRIHDESLLGKQFTFGGLNVRLMSDSRQSRSLETTARVGLESAM